jgi:hypothetical protein
MNKPSIAITRPECSFCGSYDLGKSYTDDFPINGNDDPQYSGGEETIQMADCLECGEAGV